MSRREHPDKLTVREFDTLLVLYDRNRIYPDSNRMWGDEITTELATRFPDRSTKKPTVYNILGRFLERTVVEASWEDPVLFLEERRPARRFYNITEIGKLALITSVREELATNPKLERLFFTPSLGELTPIIMAQVVELPESS